MKKLLVFDLDGTLCPFNGAMTHANMDTICRLEEEGYTIAICSGKPVYYLTGFVRQIGLKKPVLSGENGGCFQVGITMPNNQKYVMPISPKAREQLDEVRFTIGTRIPSDEIWFQPNEVEVTPFVDKQDTLDYIADIAEQICLSELTVYRHNDCYDFTPKNINKGNGVKFMAERLGFSLEDVICFGDAINDIPMFEVAGVSVLIGGRLDYKADYSFDTLEEALEELL